MKEDLPSQREQMEQRITALLLGELSPDETAALSAELEKDATLRSLHDRLKRTTELIAAAATTFPASAGAERHRLSDERRQALLTRFQQRPKKKKAARRIVLAPWLAPIGLASTILFVLGLSFVTLLKSGQLKTATSSRGETVAFSDSAKSSGSIPLAAADYAKHPVPAPVAGPAPSEETPIVERYSVLSSEPLHANVAPKGFRESTTPPLSGHFDIQGLPSQSKFGDVDSRSGALDAKRPVLEASKAAPQPQLNYSWHAPVDSEGRTDQNRPSVFYRAQPLDELRRKDSLSDRDAAGTTVLADGMALGQQNSVVADVVIAGDRFGSEPAAPTQTEGGTVQAVIRPGAPTTGVTATNRITFQGKQPEADSTLAFSVNMDKELAQNAPGQLPPNGRRNYYAGGAAGGKPMELTQARPTSPSQPMRPLDRSKKAPSKVEREDLSDLTDPTRNAVPKLNLPTARATEEPVEQLLRFRKLDTVALGIAAVEEEKSKSLDDSLRPNVEAKLEKSQGRLAEPAPAKPAQTLTPKPEQQTKIDPFSTFSLNVSDVSFQLAASSLAQNQLPEPNTVRSEEFVNAFDYHDPAPAGRARLAFAWEQAHDPWAHQRELIRFSIQTAALGREPGRPLNLVLLLDNSGSMERADRVRIVREALRVLAEQLTPADRVSVVTFARTARLWVDGLRGDQREELLRRVGAMNPEGGTNLEDALDLAYATAEKHLQKNSNNRVILLTDGAANLGNVDPTVLKQKVEHFRKRNVALDCFGIGWDGYNDPLLETLSRNGDGRYGFLNRLEEVRAGFAEQLAGALRIAASDVKAQVEFNPQRVISYRQIGYDLHQLTKEQFRDNTVDAAEIGAAEAGTALYSLQVNRQGTGPLGKVRVRFKIPGTNRYEEQEWLLPYNPAVAPFDQASPTIRLAGVAAAFAEWLARSPYAVNVSLVDLPRYLDGVVENFGADTRPKELLAMIAQARGIAGQ